LLENGEFIIMLTVDLSIDFYMLKKIVVDFSLGFFMRCLLSFNPPSLFSRCNR